MLGDLLHQQVRALGRLQNNLAVFKQRKEMGDFNERERNVLFNDALNTFYLRLYGVRHMVKNHSDSEKENPLPPHHATDRIAHTTAFVAPVVEHWLEREIAQWVHYLKEGDVLFNDALNTLLLYGVRHMVTDHSDSEKEYPAAAT